MNLQENIRKILREEVKKKFQRPSEKTIQTIIKYLNFYFKSSVEQDTPKHRAYGSIVHTLCVSGIEKLSAHFYFDDNREFYEGSLLISKELINSVMEMFSVRQSFIVSIIEDWYEDYKLPSFEERMGESGLSLNGEADHYLGNNECVPEPELPEGITDEDMIDYIVGHTLYTEQNVLDRIKSGDEDLKELYLHIVDIQNNNR